MKPKISVIIPCYNYAGYIEKCIMSVLLQRINHTVEIVIGNDNSTDESLNIINRMKALYENHQFIFKVINHEVNVGEINNTKSLLERCEGDYIAYLDADDYWINPYKLEKQLEFMESNQDYSMCITGYIIYENDSYVPASNFSSWLCPININNLNSESLCSGNIIGSSSSRFFRNYGSKIIKDYFYDFPYSDWAMNFELSFMGKVAYLNFPGYVYRKHDKSLSHIDFKKSTQDDYNRLTGILKEILNKKLYNPSEL